MRRTHTLQLALCLCLSYVLSCSAQSIYVAPPGTGTLGQCPGATNAAMQCNTDLLFCTDCYTGATATLVQTCGDSTSGWTETCISGVPPTTILPATAGCDQGGALACNLTPYITCLAASRAGTVQPLYTACISQNMAYIIYNYIAPLTQQYGVTVQLYSAIRTIVPKGGAKNSKHFVGEAVDFGCAIYTADGSKICRKRTDWAAAYKQKPLPAGAPYGMQQLYAFVAALKAGSGGSWVYAPIERSGRPDYNHIMAPGTQTLDQQHYGPLSPTFAEEVQALCDGWTPINPYLLSSMFPATCKGISLSVVQRRPSSTYTGNKRRWHVLDDTETPDAQLDDAFADLFDALQQQYATDTFEEYNQAAVDTYTDPVTGAAYDIVVTAISLDPDAGQAVS